MMLTEKVIFLDKEYEIPKEIHDYIKYLHQFESYQATLLEELEKQQQKNDWEDFETWQSILGLEVDRVIVELSHHGIFNISKEELLVDNLGFSQCKETCRNTTKALLEIQKKRLDSFMSDYTNAKARAESQITGSGVSVWTSSMTTALVYGALEARTLQKQAQKAEQDFQRELDSISFGSELEAKSASEKLLKTYYYPCIDISIRVFVGELFQKFIMKLSTEDKFNYEAISKYDKNKSNNILDNLTLIPDKKSVIREAFSLCPYNLAVYTSLIEKEIWDENSFDTARVVGCSTALIPNIINYCEKNLNNIIKLEIPVSILANYQGFSPKKIWSELYEHQIQNVTLKYADLKTAITEKSYFKQWALNNIAPTVNDLLTMTENSILKQIELVIRQIIPQISFERFLELSILKVEDLSLPGSQVTTYRELNEEYVSVLKEKIDEYIIDNKQTLYQDAVLKSNSTNINDVEIAQSTFALLGNWESSQEYHQHCQEKIKQLNIEEQNRKIAEQQHIQQQKTKKRVLCVVLVIIVMIFAALIYIVPNQQQYSEAELMLSSGDTIGAAMKFGKISGFKDAKYRSLDLWSAIIQRKTVVADDYRSSAIKNDGTVVTAGESDYGEINLGGWSDIISLEMDGAYILGLKSDGSVSYKLVDNISNTSYAKEYRRKVAKSKDIVALSDGILLKSDGTVVALDDYYDVSDWNNIIAISGSYDCVIGLKSDGTVIAYSYSYNEYHNQFNVSEWQNITDISTSGLHTVGLKADGTVVAVGSDGGQCDVSNWKDIVAIDTNFGYTLGLKKDGTVLVACDTDVFPGESPVSSWGISKWNNIVSISAGYRHAIGLKADGSIVVAYDRSESYNNAMSNDQDFYVKTTAAWSDIMVPNSKD